MEELSSKGSVVRLEGMAYFISILGERLRKLQRSSCLAHVLLRRTSVGERLSVSGTDSWRLYQRPVLDVRKSERQYFQPSTADDAEAMRE